MKNPRPTLHNDFLLKSKDNSYNIKLLGFAQVIGYNVKKIYEGKKLYKNYEDLLGNFSFNLQLERSENTLMALNELMEAIENKNFKFTKFTYNVELDKWEYKKVSFNEGIDDNKEIKKTQKYITQNDILTKVEYALLNNRVDNSTEETEKIYNAIKKINIWIDDYLKTLSISRKKYPEMANLLKQLISK